MEPDYNSENEDKILKKRNEQRERIKNLSLKEVSIFLHSLPEEDSKFFREEMKKRKEQDDLESSLFYLQYRQQEEQEEENKPFKNDEELYAYLNTLSEAEADRVWKEHLTRVSQQYKMIRNQFVDEYAKRN